MFGFEREHVSLLAGEDVVVAKLGHRYEKVEELEDDPYAPRMVYRSKASVDETKGALLESLIPIGAIAVAGAIAASGGPLAAVLGCGILGAEVGAFVAGALGDTVEDDHKKYLQEQLRHGGLLLWVRTTDLARENAAKQILSKNSGRDVHTHSFTKTSDVRASRGTP